MTSAADMLNQVPLEYDVSKALYHADKSNDLKKGRTIIPTDIQVYP